MNTSTLEHFSLFFLSLTITKTFAMTKSLSLRALLVFSVLSLTALWNCAPPKPRDDSKTKGPAFKENIRPTDPRTPDEEHAGLIVPPGFEVQLFASEPDIDKPMNLAFDAQGRMWVTSSFEYPFPSNGVTGTDRLTIVEDTDGDGKADKFTDVSDTLNIPIGILPLTDAVTGDGAITFSIPRVYRLHTNAGGKLESSSTMLGPFGYQDTHGMVSNFIRGYDGWVHACHGFTNRSSFAGKDGDTITLVSGNTFRFKLDGSRVEQLTFGQVNPFGLVFDALGYVYSTDSHSSPLYQLIRSGDYPHFGKVSVMGFGPDMKSLEEEATSLCGITQYADTQFPEEFQNNFFIGDVVNSRVHRYTATWKGSSPVGKSEDDFIKSEDPWFRPVNIKLGPDGALYVADFYNAIIGHYEAPLNHPKRDKQRGRIWRITYKGKSNKIDNLAVADVNTLISKLDVDNLPVRATATDQLTDRVGAAAVEPLKAVLTDNASSPRKYVHAMWALHRLNALAPELLAASAIHEDSVVRVHAYRVMAEQGDAPSWEMIASALADANPHVKRAGVELLARQAGVQSVQAALAVLKETKADFDNHLFYTTRLALRNMLRNETLLHKVVSEDWSEQDAGFIAAVMVDVPYGDAATFLLSYLSRYQLEQERVPAAYTQIARFTPTNQMSKVVNDAMAKNTDITTRALVYRGIMDGLNQREDKVSNKIFDAFASDIATSLLKKYPATDTTETEEKFIQQRIAIDMAGDFRVKSLEPDLKAFINEGHRLGWTMRNAALRSLLKIDVNKNAIVGASVVSSDSVQEYQRRTAAVMGEFPGKDVNKALGDLKAIPGGVQDAVVIALAGSSEGKDIVYRKVRDGELLPRVLLNPRVSELMAMNATMGQKKAYNELTADLDPIDKEKQNLIDSRLANFDALDKNKLNLDSGKMVFAQNCGVCHKVGGEMGVGPQLDGIGSTGSRGLIEKIIDPNRNVSRAFKNYNIKLKDGTVRTGLFRRNEGAARVFADISGKEFTVAKGDIAEESVSKTTLMPDAFATSIDEREFNLLINYLLSL
jgi:putative heme-binding domain-containing protein